MSAPYLRYEVRGRVAVLTYDRQERRNAWDLSAYREVVAAVETANADDGVAAIVFTHAGPIFCAGTDLKAPPEPRDPVTGIRPNIATASMAPGDSWLHLLERSKPSIAAITGTAIGLGVTQILPMDVRIGGRSSVYKLPFLQLGYMPELGATALLPRLVGYGRAVDLLLRSASVEAVEAERIGLISQVVEDDAVLDTAIALGERIGGYPALQTGLTRALLRANHAELDKDAVLERETAAFREMFRARKAARDAGAA